jgi:hypothetical protein
MSGQGLHGGALAALSLLFTGCLVSFSYENSSFSCAEEPICPPEFECVAGRCVGEQPAADAGEGADGPAIFDADLSLCGNGLCDLGEDCATCSDDCGACAAALALRWTFDDLADGTAGDASGNGHHGELVGGTQVVATGGPALSLDGVADHVLLAQAGPGLKPTGQLALSAWIETTATDTAGGEVVSLGDSYGLRVRPNGNVRFFVWDGAVFEGVETTEVMVVDGAPHHLVGQFTGTALEIWVDGALALSEPFAGAIQYDLGPDLFVGRHGNGVTNYKYQGVIDDLRIFTVALTPAEIASLASR